MLVLRLLLGLSVAHAASFYNAWKPLQGFLAATNKEKPRWPPSSLGQGEVTRLKEPLDTTPSQDLAASNTSSQWDSLVSSVQPVTSSGQSSSESLVKTMSHHSVAATQYDWLEDSSPSNESSAQTTSSAANMSLGSYLAMMRPILSNTSASNFSMVNYRPALAPFWTPFGHTPLLTTNGWRPIVPFYPSHSWKPVSTLNVTQTSSAAIVSTSPTITTPLPSPPDMTSSQEPNVTSPPDIIISPEMTSSQELDVTSPPDTTLSPDVTSSQQMDMTSSLDVTSPPDMTSSSSVVSERSVSVKSPNSISVQFVQKVPLANSNCTRLFTIHKGGEMFFSFNLAANIEDPCELTFLAPPGEKIALQVTDSTHRRRRAVDPDGCVSVFTHSEGVLFITDQLCGEEQSSSLLVTGIQSPLVTLTFDNTSLEKESGATLHLHVFTYTQEPAVG